MALTFTGTDRIESGLTAGDAKITYALTYYRTGENSGNDSWTIRRQGVGAANEGLSYYPPDGTSAFQLVRAYLDSVSPGSVSSQAYYGILEGASTAAPTNVWKTIAIYHSGAGGDQPIAYVDGTQATINTVVTPDPVRYFNPDTTINPYYIGNNVGGTQSWVGSLAEIAIWQGWTPTASELQQLSRKVSPLKFVNQYLKLYLPIVRPIVDLKGNTATATGTTVTTHPTIYY